MLLLFPIDAYAMARQIIYLGYSLNVRRKITLFTINQVTRALGYQAIAGNIA